MVSFLTLTPEPPNSLVEQIDGHFQDSYAESELLERAAHLVGRGWEAVAIDKGIWYLQIDKADAKLDSN